MKLEQIYETRFVNPLVAINAASANTLLEAFEEAVVESSNIKEILASIKGGQMPVNESELTDEQKIFFIGAAKLVNFYKESKDVNFKTRFESLINKEEYGAYTTGIGARPAAAATSGTAPAKSGWMSKLGKFFTGIGRGIKAFGQGVLSGFEGSEGKDKSGKTNPGWQDVTVNSDLSIITDRGTAFTPQQLLLLGISQETLDQLRKGTLAGVNLTDPQNNLISIKFANGQYIGSKVPTYQQAVNTTAAATTAPATTTAATTATPTTTTAESQFQKSVNRVLKEFYKTNK